MSATLLHLDPGHGASGDMVLGALLDVGVPAEVVDKAVRAVGVDARLHVEPGFRHGVRGLKIRFVDAAGAPVDPLEAGATAAPMVVRVPVLPRQNHPHDHPHDHDQQHDHDHDHHTHDHGAPGLHTPYTQLVKQISSSSLTVAVRDLALAILARLAGAESQVHGIPLDQVAFHEVATADSLGDMVGAAAAIHHLGAKRITSGPFGVCQGSVRMQHGVLPGPGPATGLLLIGAPVVGLTGTMETVTPTGAAIITTVADAYGPPPAMVLRAQGHGLGRKDPPERANMLRAWLGEAGRTAHVAPPADVVELQCNVDDSTPAVMAHAVERALSNGALDAWLAPIVMKKGRAGWTLHVLCTAELENALCGLILRETSSLGVRRFPAARRVATRASVSVDTPVGPLRIKVAQLDGADIHAAPEPDDAARAAVASGRPLTEVLDLALAAYAARPRRTP